MKFINKKKILLKNYKVKKYLYEIKLFNNKIT